MQPVRKVLSATHFKKVPAPANEHQSSMGGKWPKWTPCSPGDPEAVERSWSDVESDELLEPPLRMGDFVRAISQVRPTVTEDDIRKHVEWTNDSGEAGA
jgi:vacuolar protein-sorting-associated protein 4